MAEERGDTHYTFELGQSFISDDSHIIPENSKRYHHERTVAYTRCIKFVESYLRDGIVDFSPALHTASFPITSDPLKEDFSRYVDELEARKLKPNTIDGYRRFIYYFIEYLENKGYTVKAYRDSINGFIDYLESEKHVRRETMAFEDFSRTNITDFLDWMLNVKKYAKKPATSG